MDPFESADPEISNHSIGVGSNVAVGLGVLVATGCGVGVCTSNRPGVGRNGPGFSVVEEHAKTNTPRTGNKKTILFEGIDQSFTGRQLAFAQHDCVPDHCIGRIEVNDGDQVVALACRYADDLLG